MLKIGKQEFEFRINLLRPFLKGCYAEKFMDSLDKESELYKKGVKKKDVYNVVSNGVRNLLILSELENKFLPDEAKAQLKEYLEGNLVPA